ncbi:hypothetical protein [Zavarzinia sp. CC-PAN008]|uniref:hypothetical protein n=1 Tax=Zavarzinia sp. CC-PAN008 TaxID=3243332 RepID=UPI003F74698D
MWSGTLTDEFDPDDDDDAADLAAIGRFARLVTALPWFQGVGRRADGPMRDRARAMLDAYGFPDAGLAVLTEWEDAADAAQNPDIDDPWFEVEEQLLAALSEDASALHGEETVSIALAHVAAAAGDTVATAARDAALRGDVFDQELIDAAIGAAMRACHEAALVLISGADSDHPFALKMALFEAGRWPIGLRGNTFALF